jgi:hypothetical protein
VDPELFQRPNAPERAPRTQRRLPDVPIGTAGAKAPAKQAVLKVCGESEQDGHKNGKESSQEFLQTTKTKIAK